MNVHLVKHFFLSLIFPTQDINQSAFMSLITLSFVAEKTIIKLNSFLLLLFLLNCTNQIFEKKKKIVF